MELTKDVHSILKGFPKDEQFTFVQQMMRCALSIPCNIAEGAAKNSKSDFARYLEIALGSSFELETQIILSADLGYIKHSETIIKKQQSIQRRLSGFIKLLRKK